LFKLQNGTMISKLLFSCSQKDNTVRYLQWRHLGSIHRTRR